MQRKRFIGIYVYNGLIQFRPLGSLISGIISPLLLQVGSTPFSIIMNQIKPHGEMLATLLGARNQTLTTFFGKVSANKCSNTIVPSTTLHHVHRMGYGAVKPFLKSIARGLILPQSTLYPKLPLGLGTHTWQVSKEGYRVICVDELMPNAAIFPSRPSNQHHHNNARSNN